MMRSLEHLPSDERLRAQGLFSLGWKTEGNLLSACSFLKVGIKWMVQGSFHQCPATEQVAVGTN